MGEGFEFGPQRIWDLAIVCPWSVVSFKYAIARKPVFDTLSFFSCPSSYKNEHDFGKGIQTNSLYISPKVHWDFKFFFLELHKFLASLECISRNGLSFGEWNGRYEFELGATYVIDILLQENLFVCFQAQLSQSF